MGKFQGRSSRIGIIGLGYVGLPLARRFAEENFQVIGFDIDTGKVRDLNAGTSYIEDVANDSVARMIRNGFEATQDYSRVAEVDAVIICVPTPLDKHREPDLSFVTSTVENICQYLQPGTVVSLESTTWPGTTEEIVQPTLEKSGLKIGEELFLVYSPERQHPGQPDVSVKTIPKICSGVSPACLEMGLALYSGIVDELVPVSSTKVAEMAKLLENIHRAVNIGLVNEMKMVTDKMGMNIHEVIRAAATKPFGFVPYAPGPGLGGHCIPIDPFYLTWKAREYGVHTRFIELAGEINSEMPSFVVDKVVSALNEQQKSVKNSNILILGVAYKSDVDDVRESPALKIIDKLGQRGAIVSYSDPHVAKIPRLRNFDLNLESIELTPESLREFDCTILVTAHKKFDYKSILKHSSLIVDTRGHFDADGANLVRA